MNKNKFAFHKNKSLIFFLFLLVPIFNPNLVSAQTPLTIDTVASGFSSPLFVTFAPGDSHRIFIVEQIGRIRIVKDGSLVPGNFLNLQGQISSGGERGLLGLAFHPNYASNGYFFVNYTNPAGNTVVARFQVTANPDSADTSSQKILLTINQPFANHNGGWIGFGPNDGYLYIATGDGGSGGDPLNNGQNPLSLLGKILRIDIDTSQGYRIPPTNPYSGSADTLHEIWALGLRNPWRDCFDRQTGDFYIADVGQNNWEEIDFQPAASAGGENYGWRLKEGDHCFNPPDSCDTLTGLTDPIFEYSHSDGCSITGGYVYRGCAIPDLQGTYFFGDYCNGRVWSFRYNGIDTSEFQERTTELGIGFFNISSFGEDALGELYIVGHNNGTIYKIVPDSAISNCLGCLAISGDANGSGEISLADVIFLINFVFKAGPKPDLDCKGDANGNGMVNLADIIYLVNFIFKAGAAPVKTGVCC